MTRLMGLITESARSRVAYLDFERAQIGRSCTRYLHNRVSTLCGAQARGERALFHEAIDTCCCFVEVSGCRR